MANILHNTINHPYSIFLKSNTSTISDETKSDCDYTLERTISIPANVDCYISLTSFKFTNAFYNIDEHNNEFKSDLFDINIIPGNYSIKQLTDNLNSQQAYATFSYDTITYKITIECTSLDVYKSSILPVLGFLNEDFTFTTSVTSPYVFNLSGVNCLYILLDNITLANNSVIDNGLMKAIESIPISVTTGYSQVYNVNTTTHYKIYDSIIRHFKVKIVDENNNPVNFRGTDYYLCLHFSFSYNNIYIPSMNSFGKSDQMYEEEKEQPEN